MLGHARSKRGPRCIACRSRRRSGHDQLVELINIKRRIKSRDDPMIAAGPGRAGRKESREQEQHERPDPRPRQSLEPIGPHYVSSALTDNAWTLKTDFGIDADEVLMLQAENTAVLCQKQRTH